MQDWGVAEKSISQPEVHRCSCATVHTNIVSHQVCGAQWEWSNAQFCTDFSQQHYVHIYLTKMVTLIKLTKLQNHRQSKNRNITISCVYGLVGLQWFETNWKMKKGIKFNRYIVYVCTNIFIMVNFLIATSLDLIYFFVKLQMHFPQIWQCRSKLCY